MTLRGEFEMGGYCRGDAGMSKQRGSAIRHF